jgi:hypothetical protein
LGFGTVFTYQGCGGIQGMGRVEESMGSEYPDGWASKVRPSLIQVRGELMTDRTSFSTV